MLPPQGEQSLGLLLQTFYRLAADELVRLEEASPDDDGPIAQANAMRRKALAGIFDPPAVVYGGGDDWEAPRLTGDAVTDRWEQAIARGETPDLEDEG